MRKINILILAMAILMMGCLERTVKIPKLDASVQEKIGAIEYFFENINKETTISGITVNFTNEGAIGTTYSAMKLDLLKAEEYNICSMVVDGDNITTKVRRVEKKIIQYDINIFDTSSFSDNLNNYKDIVTDSSISVTKLSLNVEYKVWDEDKGNYTPSDIKTMYIGDTIENIVPGKVGLGRTQWNYLSVLRDSTELNKYKMASRIKEVKVLKDESAYYIKGINYVEKTYVIKLVSVENGNYKIDMSSFLVSK